MIESSKNFNKLIDSFENLRNQLEKKSRHVSLLEHLIVIIVGLVFSIFSYTIFLKILNLHFKIPETTTISWYTVNNYPRQQDYFYFFSAFIFVLGITCLIWVFYIWRKKIK